MGVDVGTCVESEDGGLLVNFFWYLKEWVVSWELVGGGSEYFCFDVAVVVDVGLCGVDYFGECDGCVGGVVVVGEGACVDGVSFNGENDTEEVLHFGEKFLYGPVWEDARAVEYAAGIEYNDVGAYGVVGNGGKVARCVAEGGDDVANDMKEVWLWGDEGVVGKFADRHCGFPIWAFYDVHFRVVGEPGVSGVVGECVDYEVVFFGVEWEYNGIGFVDGSETGGWIGDEPLWIPYMAEGEFVNVLGVGCLCVEEC